MKIQLSRNFVLVFMHPFWMSNLKTKVSLQHTDEIRYKCLANSRVSGKKKKIYFPLFTKN